MDEAYGNFVGWAINGRFDITLGDNMAEKGLFSRPEGGVGDPPLS